MIHSLSGGVIRENGSYTFVKVQVEGELLWYLSPTSKVEAGARVSVPYGRGDLPREGRVVKVESANAQCAPCPMNRIRELYEIL